MRQAGELSVEEILESIKKVIARDNRAGAAEERRERGERGVIRPAAVLDDAVNDDEVLDLAAEDALVDDDDAPVAEGPLLTEDVTSSMRDSSDRAGHAGRTPGRATDCPLRRNLA